MIYFVLQTPSLQHLAAVKTVAHLWTRGDIFTQIARLPVHHVRPDTKEWKEMEQKVKSVVTDLSLPEKFKKQLFNLVNPLGSEIVAWCKYHIEGMINNFQFLDNLLPQQLCWTMHGTIDYAKSAELMVKDGRLSIELRYELACLSCLEKEARELFESMGEGRPHEYRMKHFTLFDGYDLVVFFTCTLIGDGNHLRKYFQMLPSHSSPIKCIFETMVCSGTRATFEYLFKKLNQRDKAQVLEERFRHRHASSSGSVLYYLSLLNAEQQESVFRECMLDLLLCLLRFPLQSLFSEVVECRWRLMYKDDRTNILRAIISKLSRGFRDYDYAQLFWQCWRLSTAEYKRLYLDDMGIVSSLIHTREEEFIRLILNEAPWYQILSLCNGKNKNRRVLMDESVISDAALMECAETAALESSNDEEDEEKRLRSEHVSRFVDLVMEERIKRIGLSNTCI